MNQDSDITDLLHAWRDGGPEGLDQLMPQIMDELRRLARGYLASERPDHTLQPTALINELYLRLAGSQLRGFADRHHFFAFAASLLRRILVDHGRARRSLKRGGRTERVPLDMAADQAASAGLDLDLVLAVDQALAKLVDLNPRQAKIVELRYFGGLGLPEIASLLDLSQSSVERSWRAAKHWLAHQMTSSPASAQAHDLPLR